MFLFAFESIAITASITPFIIIIQFLFGGFFINFNHIPYYLYELLYTSIFKYTWGAVMINEFDTFDMDACVRESSADQAQCDAIDFYDIELSLWGNIGVTLAHTLLIHLFAFWFLHRISKGFRT